MTPKGADLANHAGNACSIYEGVYVMEGDRDVHDTLGFAHTAFRWVKGPYFESCYQG